MSRKPTAPPKEVMALSRREPIAPPETNFEQREWTKNPCAMCRAELQETEFRPSGHRYLLPGTVELTARKRVSNPETPEIVFRELTITKRFCPKCAQVVEDLLMGFGFNFQDVSTTMFVKYGDE